MNQFTKAAEDLSKVEAELYRAGYTNKTHTGPHADAIGALWDRMTQADNVAEMLDWSDEAANDRAEQYRIAYNGWAAVAKQLAIAEAEIETYEIDNAYISDGLSHDDEFVFY